MKRIAASVALVVLTLPALGAGECVARSLPFSTSSMAFQVLDPALVPLPNVPITITARDRTKISSRTDKKGHVAFEGLSPGLYSVLVEGHESGFDFEQFDVRLFKANDAPGGVVAVRLGFASFGCTDSRVCFAAGTPTARAVAPRCAEERGSR